MTPAVGIRIRPSPECTFGSVVPPLKKYHTIVMTMKRRPETKISTFVNLKKCLFIIHNMNMIEEAVNIKLISRPTFRRVLATKHRLRTLHML